MKSMRILCQRANSPFLRVIKTALKIKRLAGYVVIVLSLVVVGLAVAASGGQAGHSETELQPEIAKVLDMDSDSMIRMIRSMSRERLMSLVRSVNPYVLAQVVRAMDPNRIARLIQVAADDPSLVQSGLPPPERPSLTAVSEDLGASPLSPRSEASEDAFDDGALAVIIHPSNPLTELSRSELRMILSGQVNNWSQLGGPDVPLELMASGAGVSRDLPSGSACFHLVTSPFSSVIVAGVAETRGALGLIPANGVQRAFLSSHSAIKRIAIRRGKS
jgi:hypothetical protein